MVQALGSASGKTRLRKDRRDQKKSGYAEYLNSPTWRRKRAAVLRREKNRCQASACESKATVVHHVRYPKILGQERMEWLYALCVPHHDEIHRLADKMTLRKATRLILDAPQSPPRKQPKPKKRQWPEHTQKDSKKVAKKAGLRAENDLLHAIQVRNRQRREGHGT